MSDNKQYSVKKQILQRMLVTGFAGAIFFGLSAIGAQAGQEKDIVVVATRLVYGGFLGSFFGGISAFLEYKQNRFDYEQNRQRELKIDNG